jgi:hypothetical protein
MRENGVRLGRSLDKVINGLPRDRREKIEKAAAMLAGAMMQASRDERPDEAAESIGRQGPSPLAKREEGT